MSLIGTSSDLIKVNPERPPLKKGGRHPIRAWAKRGPGRLKGLPRKKPAAPYTISDDSPSSIDVFPENSLWGMVAEAEQSNPWIKYNKLISKGAPIPGKGCSYKLTRVVCQADNGVVLFEAEPIEAEKKGYATQKAKKVGIGVKITAQGTPELVETPSLNGYKLLETLGKGGFGLVFKAQNSSGQVVAAKLAWEERNVALLRTEADKTPKKNHPQLIKCYSFSELEAPNKAALAIFDFIPGQLLSRVVNEKPMNPLTAVNLMVGLCQAHIAGGEDHNDYNPSNMKVVDEDAQGNKLPEDQWKLVAFDWGNRPAVEGQIRKNQTLPKEERKLFGTAKFLPPEVIMSGVNTGNPETDFEVDYQAIDIYALGTTLYEMVMGLGSFRKSKTIPDLFSTKISGRLPAIMNLPQIEDERGNLEENPIATYGIKPLDKEPIPPTMDALPTHLAYHLQRIVWRATAQRRVDQNAFYIGNGSGGEYSDMFIYDRYENMAEMLTDLLFLKGKMEAWQRAAGPGYVLKEEREGYTTLRYSPVYYKEVPAHLKALGFKHQKEVIFWKKAAGFETFREMKAWLKNEGLDTVEGVISWQQATGFKTLTELATWVKEADLGTLREMTALIKAGSEELESFGSFREMMANCIAETQEQA